MDIPPVIERGIDDGNLGYGLDRDAARDAVRTLMKALTDLIEWSAGADMQIDSEWGDGVYEEDPEITSARAALLSVTQAE